MSQRATPIFPLHPECRAVIAAQRLVKLGTGIGLLLEATTLDLMWQVYSTISAPVYVMNGQVLLLDVARFKYPPHWVPLPLLYESMQALDAATGRCRGYVLMSRSEVSTSLLLTVSRSKLDKASAIP
jgi:hypothetical protein